MLVKLVTSNSHRDTKSLTRHGNDRRSQMRRHKTDSFRKATGQISHLKHCRSQEHKFCREEASGRQTRLKVGLLILIMGSLHRFLRHKALRLDRQTRIVPQIRVPCPHRFDLMAWKHFLIPIKTPAKPRGLALCTHGSTSNSCLSQPDHAKVVDARNLSLCFMQILSMLEVEVQ